MGETGHVLHRFSKGIAQHFVPQVQGHPFRKIDAAIECLHGIYQCIVQLLHLVFGEPFFRRKFLETHSVQLL